MSDDATEECGASTNSAIALLFVLACGNCHRQSCRNAQAQLDHLRQDSQTRDHVLVAGQVTTTREKT